MRIGASPARRAWVAYGLVCLLAVYAHAGAVLLALRSDWMLHPLRGPFGGALLLMPVTIAIVLAAVETAALEG